MTERLSLTLHNAQQGHVVYLDAWRWAKNLLLAGQKLSMALAKATRTSQQNALMWSALTDISRQVDWPVNGRMQKLEAEDWKDILSAGLRSEQRVAQGISGGFVLLGLRTSRMTRGEMAELITLAHAFGDERGVRWSKTSLGRDWPEEMAA